jgi:hypothetical protein
MALSLGLMISLGFTTLLCLLLFFYIRQRTASIESKVTTLFKVVQDEVSRKNELCMRPQQMTVTEVQNAGHVQESVFNNNNESEYDSDTDSDVSSLTSDGEDEETDNEDLISVSTNGEETDNEDMNNAIDEVIENETESKPIKITHSNDDKLTNDGNLETISDLNLFTTIMKNGTSTIEKPQQDTDNEREEDNDDINDDLSELESLGLVEDDNNIEDTNNNDQIVLQESQTVFINNNIGDVINYKKLSVAQLRDIVSEKNLHENPKKLKKGELVELLQA